LHAKQNSCPGLHPPLLLRPEGATLSSRPPAGPNRVKARRWAAALKTPEKRHRMFLHDRSIFPLSRRRHRSRTSQPASPKNRPSLLERARPYGYIFAQASPITRPPLPRAPYAIQVQSTHWSGASPPILTGTRPARTIWRVPCYCRFVNPVHRKRSTASTRARQPTSQAQAPPAGRAGRPSEVSRFELERLIRLQGSSSSSRRNAYRVSSADQAPDCLRVHDRICPGARPCGIDGNPPPAPSTASDPIDNSPRTSFPRPATRPEDEVHAPRRPPTPRRLRRHRPATNVDRHLGTPRQDPPATSQHGSSLVTAASARAEPQSAALLGLQSQVSTGPRLSSPN